MRRELRHEAVRVLLHRQRCTALPAVQQKRSFLPNSAQTVGIRLPGSGQDVNDEPAFAC